MFVLPFFAHSRVLAHVHPHACARLAGGVWNYLETPKSDVHGKPYKCGPDCHLHLHGLAHGFGPFYSVKSAPDIIMGTGA